MFNFPLYLDFQGKKAVVAGGGNVAWRKVEKLLAASADVTVVSPELIPFLYDKYEKGAIRWIQDHLRPEHIKDAYLIVSASGSKDAQDIIAQSARSEQLVNGADNPQIGNAAFPAVVETEDIHIAISSRGKDPASAKAIRKELETWLQKKKGENSMARKDWKELMHVTYPIIQAPMAGGVTTTELVTAVSNSGGLGMIGAGYMTPEKMKEQIREVKEETDHAFGVNLFVPQKFTYSEHEMKAAETFLEPIREELGVPEKENKNLPTYDEALQTFQQKIEQVINENVSICSFTFGLPSRDIVAKLKKQGIILIGTATTVKEAIAAEQSGMDMVVVQGSEAGGHRGNFLSEQQESMIGLMSLLPQAVDHVDIPVIAAGGIMDGRGLMAALSLGAEAVQMGTAFLTCQESGAHRIHKDVIVEAEEEETRLTRAFSGKWARGIKNALIIEGEKIEEEFPEFPVQNTLTKEIRKTAAAQSEPDYMSLWSGQSPRLARTLTAAELIQRVIDEAEDIKNRFRMN